jgi:hypothetical protein
MQTRNIIIVNHQGAFCEKTYSTPQIIAGGMPRSKKTEKREPFLMRNLL